MYDVIVVGVGPAGLSASLYTSRGNLKTLMIGRKTGGNLAKAKQIENYCFIESATGIELIERGINQTKQFGTEVIFEEVTGIKKDEDKFTVYTERSQYSSKSVILATGKSKAKVKVDNIEKFEGKGVHYCVSCDGFFYVNSKVGVVGYKDFAIHEIREFEGITSNIVLYTNGNSLEISDENQKYLKDNKIEVNQKEIKSFDGDDFLERVVFVDGEEEKIDGIFIAYSSASSLDFARGLGISVERDSIKVNSKQMTEVPGVFAAGDCTGGLAQVATAVGEGAIAGQQIKSYLSSLKKGV